MNRSHWRALKWVLILWGSILAVSAQARELRFVTGDAFPPFTDRDIAGGGIVTEIVRTVFERAGYETVTIIWRSWLKGYELTVEGNVDGTFPYAFTRTRAKSVLFSDPITSLKAYGWYSRNGVRFDDKVDLLGKSLCLPLGYAELGYAGRLFGNGQAKRVSPPDMKTCFKLLDAGRVDSVISPIPEALGAIQAAGLLFDDFGHIEEGLSDMPLHFIVGKNNADAAKIIADFNVGLLQLRQSGELASILATAEY
ncbi:hypothetical protein TH8_12930 [Thalassospira profundimaris]|nr:hypothetical protein TH8_12930 [Thalassospira profundimaris]